MIVGGEVSFHVLKGALHNSVCHFSVFGAKNQPASETVRTSRFAEVPSGAVFNHLRDTSDPAGDYQRAHSHRLQYDVRYPF
jgi:hypothetical protein